MESLELESNWLSLKHEGSTEYVLKRIDSICIPELSLAIDSDSSRCLLLELPDENMIEFEVITRRNLTIEPYADLNCIILKLTDDSYNDLFNDLIVSLYQRVKEIDNPTESSRIFIQTFHKWSEFFHDESSERLSKEQVKGLFGELFILKTLCADADPIDINNVLSSWVGPYDRVHDFCFDEKDIEVKTKDNKKLDIRISSEHQLEAMLNKGLELVVVSVEEDYVGGESIGDLFSDIRQLVSDKLGDPSIVFETLKQKKLNAKNIRDYDNFRYKVVQKDIYDCLLEDFPRLVKSKLPDTLNDIHYSLNTSGLGDYLLSTEKF
ncbi:MAG: PD-(D/E)XK motif protein [Bacteriovoracaceae bacterium]|nr:PD-(D/E)XK motif protein [Bacteriovoracaceae bacterium]